MVYRWYQIISGLLGKRSYIRNVVSSLRKNIFGLKWPSARVYGLPKAAVPEFCVQGRIFSGVRGKILAKLAGLWKKKVCFRGARHWAEVV